MSESYPVRQAPDLVPTRAIVIVAVLVVLVTMLASLVPAWMLARRNELHLDAPRRAALAPVAPREIDLVDQTLLESRDATLSARAKQQRRLEEYGFVDRANGIVHIPIERAMELFLQEQARSPRSADPPLEGGAP